MESKTHINDILIKLLLKGCGQNGGSEGSQGRLGCQGKIFYMFLQTANVFQVSLAT